MKLVDCTTLLPVALIEKFDALAVKNVRSRAAHLRYLILKAIEQDESLKES